MTGYYKSLRAGRRGTHTDFVWPEPGEWVEVDGPLVPCENGLHVCRVDQLLDWLSDEVWRVEVDESAGVVDAGTKTVARRVRLVEQVTAWNETTALLFAADCAERVLHLFERERPDDDRPRKAIEAARAYARGEISAAARDAAGSAARSAAQSAAQSAAWAAAQSAAQSAAWAAAWDARGAAGAAWAARDAAGAAWAAAWAARGAAGDAERKWQKDRLAEILADQLIADLETQR